MSEINQANHESWKTIKRCDHGNVTEFDPSSRTRETDKDQTGHDGQTKEANHNLQCGHAMTVKTVRVGVPIAYGANVSTLKKKASEKDPGTSPAMQRPPRRYSMAKQRLIKTYSPRSMPANCA